MSGTSILYRAPAGVVGDVTRELDTITETALCDQSTPPDAFGQPVIMDGGKARKFTSGDVAADVFGFLRRTIPSIGNLDGTDVNKDAPQGIVVKGYLLVECKVGTPVRGGIVYVRVTADTGKLVGAIEANDDTSKTERLYGCSWASDDKDINNIAEIRIMEAIAVPGPQGEQGIPG